MKAIKINKKAQQTQFAKISAAIIVMVVVGLAIYGMIKLGVLDTLKNIIPGFGTSNEIQPPADTGIMINVGEICSNIKNEIKISDNLRQRLIIGINRGDEIHVQCGASNKEQPFIYYLNTHSKYRYYMRWDYIKDDWVPLYSGRDLSEDPGNPPTLDFSITLRILADLKNTLGVNL